MSYYQQPPQPQPGYTMADFQRRQDEDNLKLLSIFHYVLGGLTLAGGLYFLFWIFLGTAVFSNPNFGNGHGGNNPPPEFMSSFFTIMGIVGVLVCGILGGLKIHAGRCLANREAYNFIFVIACIDCLYVPVGTALGVFTILVLNRPSVKAMFDGTLPPYPPTGTPPYAASDASHPWYRS